MISRTLFILAATTISATQSYAALHGRDLDGIIETNEAYYDDLLNVTWLADWNAAAGTQFDDAASATDGLLTLESAKAWATSLQFSINGITIDGWRLPRLTPVNGTSFQFARRNNATSDIGTAPTGLGLGIGSEMGHLYYVTLGNLGVCIPNDQDPSSCAYEAASGMKNVGPFKNIDLTSRYVYSYETTVPNISTLHFALNILSGYQSTYSASFADFGQGGVVAVRDGDISAVPEPQTYALWLTGIALLLFRSTITQTLRSKHRRIDA